MHSFMAKCLQPIAVESRYVCRVHQRNHQTSKRDYCASARGNPHHGNNNLASADRPTDVDNKTTSGRHMMMSSMEQADNDEETMREDRVMQEDVQEQLAAAADDNEEPVWIARSPTSNGSSCQHRQYISDVSPTDRQLAAEEFLLDDHGIRRRRRRISKKDDSTFGCHRAHALFVWKRAIVEWRTMSAVIDRLLFVFFLVATVLIYVVILFVLPIMKSTATVISPPVTVVQSPRHHAMAVTA